MTRFSVDIIRFCAEIRKDRNIHLLADQLMRSATSIGANIIEAKASGSRRDYIHFFHIALKSANETEYWLKLVEETCLHLASKAGGYSAEVQEIGKVIGAGILTMKGR